MNDHQTKEPAPEQSRERIAEHCTGESGHAEAAHDEKDLVPACLPEHDGVLQKIRCIPIDVRRGVLVKDPEDVCPPESALDVVGIPVAIDMLMMRAMARRPLQDRV